MKTTTTAHIKRVEDGPPGNSVVYHSIRLVVTVEGLPSIERSIAKFDDGYESIAKSFCDWLNTRLAGTPL